MFRIIYFTLIIMGAVNGGQVEEIPARQEKIPKYIILMPSEEERIQNVLHVSCHSKINETTESRLWYNFFRWSTFLFRNSSFVKAKRLTVLWCSRIWLFIVFCVSLAFPAMEKSYCEANQEERQQQQQQKINVMKSFRFITRCSSSTLCW